ncbi:MAG: extracellular solute-binding protein [Candidatus Pristimantibacillus lignocellulolyticus]|uniref:Extracellular solute-binding protein n=1 Tax=Candidatus Pristimantibacillus lignocellulolyticus TaxID=2994561 RepID=A0A9J6ZI79_9BACL|nr:MAG: extracellular solute-binding protein [Candidatus Pristimantibacillus lignocellulolyticus]
MVFGTKMKAVLLIAMCTTLVACSSGGNGKGNKEVVEKTPVVAADPFGRFEETITVSLGKAMSVDIELPPGDTQENNEYVRFIEEELNVKFNYDWQTADGDPYKQKMDLVIVSESVPDVMLVDEAQLKLLVDADLIADLTDVYEANISPELREVFESTKELSLASATFDGKLMAVPNSSPGADAMNTLFIRKDWLDAVGLPVPKTLEDIEVAARAFIDNNLGGGNNQTIGLVGQQDIVNIGNSIFGFDTIFSYFDAYPELWVKNDDGTVEYGSIQPETKVALAKLRDMYANGVIHREFVAETGSSGREKIISGRAGMFFGPFWMPSWIMIDNLKLDPKAEWVTVAVPLDKEGKFKTHTMSPTSSYLAVSKKMANPEAVIRILNHEYIIDQTRGNEFYIDQNVRYNRVNLPFGHMMAPFDEKEIAVVKVDEVLAGTREYDTLLAHEKIQYDRIVYNNENPKKDLLAWASSITVDTTRGMIQSNVEKVTGAFYGKTTTMNRKWVNLKKLEDETFIQIIMGDKPIDAFDQFVADWKKQGGDEITSEVNEAVK